MKDCLGKNIWHNEEDEHNEVNSQKCQKACGFEMAIWFSQQTKSNDENLSKICYVMHI